MKRDKGITLIALVVTIIVLLILAGISISMLTGQNGILRRVSEAKDKTSIASQEEQSILNDYEEQIADYAGINWDLAKSNAKDPKEQKEERNNGVIGIGTDGKPVNMDLWEYTLMDVGSYVLNDDQYTIQDSKDSSIERSGGYLGTIKDNGQIEGTIPQYISVDNGKTYVQVISLRDTFRKIEELQEMPQIPYTIVNLSSSFEGCKKLNKLTILPYGISKMDYTFCDSGITKVCNIPNSVETLNGTFSYCSNLEDGRVNIPENVISMNSIFSNCKELKNVGNINSQKVINMKMAYYNCEKLENIPEIIPTSVDDLTQCFQGCKNLRGYVTILCNPTKCANAFMNVAINEKSKLVIRIKSEEVKEKMASTHKWSTDSKIEYQTI